MAKIPTGNDEKIYRINKFFGINECPDGETKLKFGEANRMENWCITRDGNLKRRPGTYKKLALANVKGLWSGYINGNRYILCASNSKMYKVYDGQWQSSEIGAINTTGSVFVFGFDDKAYIMDGHKYYEYDGTTYKEVEGYIPTVIIGATPATGSGTTYEQINKLTTKRKVQYSPDGSATAFRILETASAVISVKIGGVITSDYTFSGNVVTFSSAPSVGVNTVEICYNTTSSLRNQVEAMRYCETFNGSQDTRVFIYGDGTNKCIYSGVDIDGFGRADYFPDMNEMSVGDENTPVTSMIRHSNRLIVFKSSSTYSVSYSTMTLADSSVIPAFVVTPVNRNIGCAGYNQAQLVLNYPRTLFGTDVYEWKNSSSYSSVLTSDERQARRISDRVHRSLATFNIPECVCYDDNDHQEYYVVSGSTAIVHNYAVDAWYYYSSFNADCFCNMNGELYFGSSDGIYHMSSQYNSDNGTAINAYWESGAISFNEDYMRKFANNLWVSVKPESNTYLDVTCVTDRKSDFATKNITYRTGGFAAFDFSNFIFNDTSQPQMNKLRLKAKKFAYYKIIFENDEIDTVATVLAVDIMVRTTGYVK